MYGLLVLAFSIITIAGEPIYGIVLVVASIMAYAAGLVAPSVPQDIYIMDNKELDEIMDDIARFPYDKTGNAQISRGMVRLIVEDAVNRDRRISQEPKDAEAELQEENAMH